MSAAIESASVIGACGFVAAWLRTRIPSVLLGLVASFGVGTACAAYERAWVHFGIRLVLTAVALWLWWRNGGDDDFRKGRRKAARAVREVAGKLTVVPATAGAR